VSVPDLVDWNDPPSDVYADDPYVGVPLADLEDPAPVDLAASWRPLDLGPYLRGETTRPEPDVGMRRGDGIQLIYAAKEHTVIGEMESGKSWFCAACAVAEMTNGNHVMYVHFEESDPTDTVERLLELGMSVDVITRLFHFVGPEEPYTRERLAHLLAYAPTLVVFDGVNEAMSLHRWGIREEDGAAAFRRCLVKPCTAAGAAVLSADHVVKDREKRDRGPLGSIHKGNGLTGSLILLENVAPFGRGARGCSHVFVTKDRPGFLRRNGRADRKTPGKTFMGSLIVDDTRTWVSYLDLAFIEPQDAKTDDEAPAGNADDAPILAAVADIAKDGEVNMRRIYARSPFGKDRTVNAVERLVLSGALKETAGPRRARLFTVPEPPAADSAEVQS